MTEYNTSKRSLCIAAIIVASLPSVLQSFTLPQTNTRIVRSIVNARSNTGMQALSSVRKDVLDQEKTEFAPKPGTTGPRPTSSASSTLNMIVDGRREFEMNVGKAVDTLRNDYPKMFQDQMVCCAKHYFHVLDLITHFSVYNITLSHRTLASITKP